MKFVKETSVINPLDKTCQIELSARELLLLTGLVGCSRQDTVEEAVSLARTVFNFPEFRAFPDMNDDLYSGLCESVTALTQHRYRD